MTTIIKNPKKRRQIRVRKKLAINKGIPRLSLLRTNRFIWAQIIDDKKGRTLLALSTKSFKKTGTKTQASSLLGEKIAKLALEKNILSVRFDKGPYRYHGRVKALAEAARKAGLKI